MNEIRLPGLVHDRYKLRFSQLVHKLSRSVLGPACSVSKACGACRTCHGEMRGPLREQIQNAINRALHESLGDSQAAYINVGGRRRNRKKNKNKKNNGVSGSAWSIIYQQQNEPPIRSRVDIPPKVKGSPTVTKAKKTCKEIKARLSPPRCRKDNGDQDDKPLIDDDAAEDGNYENQVDQENIDPSKMPLSKLFKTTKAKKSKKGKDKDGTDNSSVASDDVTKSSVTSESQPQTIVEKSTEDVTLTPSSDDVIVTPSSDDVTKTAENEVTDKVPFEDDAKEGKETDVTGDEPNASDGKTDLAAGDDTPAVLYTTENRDVTMTMGEGPQLTQSAGGVAVEGQPIKADGSLPPETGREKESLLRDHNPEGMICCTIL